MDLAKGLMKRCFETPGRRPGLWVRNGRWVMWKGDRWVMGEEEAVERAVWLGLEGTWVVATRQGVAGVERVAPKRALVGEVVSALQALCWDDGGAMPRWLGGEPAGMPASHCVAFEDVVVNYRTGQEEKRDERWFGTVVLPATWAEVKVAPEPREWLKAAAFWSGGPKAEAPEPAWLETAERGGGLAITNDRSFPVWMLLYGVVRGGKTMKLGFIKRTLGYPAFWSTKAEDLAGSFGLSGLPDATVVSITEGDEIGRGVVGRWKSVAKSIVGGDPLEVNRKGVRQFQCEPRAMLWVTGNEMMEVPDTSSGLSSKMVLLPYKWSALGREDQQLGEKLWAERAGIYRRWMAAVKRLSEGSPWPKVESAQEDVREFRWKNDPMKWFVEECFVKAEGRWVTKALVREMRRRWQAKREQPLPVTDQFLAAKVVQAVPEWGLGMGKRNGEPVVVGLALRGDVSEG